MEQEQNTPKLGCFVLRELKVPQSSRIVVILAKFNFAKFLLALTSLRTNSHSDCFSSLTRRLHQKFLIISSTALSKIKAINSTLGFPEYVYDDMMSTRALDGKQTYTGKRFSASRRYHPDSGLEVTYTENQFLLC